MTMFDAMKSLTGETAPDRIYELIKEYKVRFSDKYMTANTHLYPETLPVLKALKEQGSRCCIVSTKTRSRINETLRKYAMEDLIDLVVGMEDVDNAKPAPDGINRSATISAWIKKTFSISRQHHRRQGRTKCRRRLCRRDDRHDVGAGFSAPAPCGNHERPQSYPCYSLIGGTYYDEEKSDDLGSGFDSRLDVTRRLRRQHRTVRRLQGR